MKLRKVLAITVALALLVTLNPLPSVAQAQDTDITLEEAIQTAKELFPAATQYSEFVSEFSTSPQSSYWHLQWSAGESGEGGLSVQINAQTGDVIHMYRWDQQSGQPASVSMSASEAQAIADRWLKKILPKKSARLQLINTPAIVPLTNSGYGNFSFQYQRIENGLPVLGDMAYLEVDARSRDISSYNLSWTHVPLPDPSKVVAASVASQTFQTEDMLKLEYFLPHSWLLRSSTPSQLESVRLIYRIDHASNGTINALTGKPLVLKEGQNERYASDLAMKEMVGGMGAADQAASPSLTPQEIAELEKRATVISKEEAAAKIKQWVDIPAQAVLNRASLNRDWQNKDSRTWNLNWGLPQGTEGEYYDLWARIDATSGRIYSFNQYTGDPALTGTLTQDQATAMAQDFIGKIEPQLSKQVKLNQAEPWNAAP